MAPAAARGDDAAFRGAACSRCVRTHDVSDVSAGASHGARCQEPTWETLLATAILIPSALAFAPAPRVAWNAPLALLLLYAAIPGTALAYWAVAMASRDLPAVTTSLGLLATPVVGVVVATVWLREPLTHSLIVAIVLVLGGVAIGATSDRDVRRRQRRRPRGG